MSNFPSTAIESLTMLYLQKQDLTNCTPEQIVDMYFETYDKVNDRYCEVIEERRTERRKS